jgi:hypothetical protein
MLNPTVSTCNLNSHVSVKQSTNSVKINLILDMFCEGCPGARQAESGHIEVGGAIKDRAERPAVFAGEGAGGVRAPHCLAPTDTLPPNALSAAATASLWERQS